MTRRTGDPSSQPLPRLRVGMVVLLVIVIGDGIIPSDRWFQMDFDWIEIELYRPGGDRWLI